MECRFHLDDGSGDQLRLHHQNQYSNFYEVGLQGHVPLEKDQHCVKVEELRP